MASPSAPGDAKPGVSYSEVPLTEDWTARRRRSRQICSPRHVVAFLCGLATLTFFKRYDVVSASARGEAIPALLSVLDDIRGPDVPPPYDVPPPLDDSCRGAHWEPSTPAWVCKSQSERTSPTFHPNELARVRRTCRTRTRAYRCARHGVRAIVAGPFTSRPGEWHSITLDYAGLLSSSSPVVQFTSDAIDATGSPVAYPPLHMHHIHVTRGAVNHWYETHGDYAMDSKLGYVREKPPQPKPNPLLAPLDATHTVSDPLPTKTEPLVCPARCHSHGLPRHGLWLTNNRDAPPRGMVIT